MPTDERPFSVSSLAVRGVLAGKNIDWRRRSPAISWAASDRCGEGQAPSKLGNAYRKLRQSGRTACQTGDGARLLGV